jgi:EAL domain-containing protein (putative c-di-GMP-specific phosphodiesterase class I)
MGFTILILNTYFSQSAAITAFTLSILTAVIAITLLISSLSLLKKADRYIGGGLLTKDRSRIKQLHKLLDGNLFEYHFQPIIDAKNGEIFAYEALMRSSPGFDMKPIEILDLAAYENRLYDIENYTYQNSLRILKENRDAIKNRKLFINSISSHPLKDSDFEYLLENYKNQFSDIVIEITEGSLLSDSGINSMQRRLAKTNCQLALDEYGTGFSNESCLLKTNPHYIKIDRAILKDINADPKKQHLVSNIVNFSYHNSIKTIAEGIETPEEFQTVIHLGIDYIQGFFTAKPAPFFLHHLPQEYIDLIRKINSQKSFALMPDNG